MAKTSENLNNNLSAGLAEVLKQQRLNLGLNQTELAKRAGLNRSYVSEVERGCQNITIETLSRLANALEVSVLSLVEQANRNVRSLVRPLEILLIEDNEADIYILKHSLGKLKAPTNLKIARDGKEALELISSMSSENSDIPDLILLDLNLPKRSGHEILKKVKSDSRFSQVPVVVLSTSNDRNDIEKSYALNANTFITKPLNQKDFENAIAVVIEYWSVIAEVSGR